MSIPYDTQFPPISQHAPDWRRDDYVASLWYNAIKTYGLSGSEAAEYVRIERELDAIEASPFLEIRAGERAELLRRHAELTAPRQALGQAA
jgi:hypothetical protein